MFFLFFLQKCSERNTKICIYTNIKKVVVPDFWNFDFCLFYGPRNIKKSRFFAKIRVRSQKKCHKTAKNQKIKNLVLQVLDNTPKKWFVQFQSLKLFWGKNSENREKSYILRKSPFCEKIRFFLTFGQDSWQICIVRQPIVLFCISNH